MFELLLFAVVVFIAVKVAFSFLSRGKLNSIPDSRPDTPDESDCNFRVSFPDEGFVLSDKRKVEVGESLDLLAILVMRHGFKRDTEFDQGTLPTRAIIVRYSDDDRIYVELMFDIDMEHKGETCRLARPSWDISAESGDWHDLKIGATRKRLAKLLKCSEDDLT